MDDDSLDSLLSGLPRQDASEWAVQEALARIEEDRDRSVRRRRSGLLAGAAVAALAAAGVVIAVLLPTPEAPPMALKGADVAMVPSIELGLSLSRDSVPVALVPGEAARPSDTVLLRYTTDSEGFAYLFRVGPDGDLEVFHGTPALPGTHHFMVDGAMVGYALDGLAGEHRFGVALSTDPWPPGSNGEPAAAPESLARAARRGPFPRALPGTRVQLDVRSVTVSATP